MLQSPWVKPLLAGLVLGFGAVVVGMRADVAKSDESNTTLTTYSQARSAVLEKGPLAVPLKLRNAPTPLMKSMGYSGGYRYPHNFSGNYVPEEYLPDELRGQRFYEPSGSGEEAQIRERLAKWREELESKREAEERQTTAEAETAKKLK